MMAQRRAAPQPQQPNPLRPDNSPFRPAPEVGSRSAGVPVGSLLDMQRGAAQDIADPVLNRDGFRPNATNNLPAQTLVDLNRATRTGLAEDMAPPSNDAAKRDIEAPAAPSFEQNLRDTKFTSTPAVKADNGRGYRIKKDGAGFIGIRMSNENGKPNTEITTPEGIKTLAEILPQAFGPDDLAARAEDQSQINQS